MSGDADKKDEVSGDTDKKDEVSGDADKKDDEVPGKIGDAEMTEKDNEDSNTEVTPNPGAEPIIDETKDAVTTPNEDGSSTISQPTVTPGKETTTITGSGDAKADMKPTTEKTDADKINLKDELGENPDIKWDITDDDLDKGTIKVKDYTVVDVKNENDGKDQTLTLRKENTSHTNMTADDIAKLLDAEKATAGEDGSYTLTRTETRTEEDGTVVTITTYITIKGSDVTTTTTTELTISRKKFENEGGNEIETKVEYPTITVKNDETGEDETVIDSDLLFDIINGSKGDKQADGSYKYDDGNGNEYEVTIDSELSEKLTNREIVERLNDSRYQLEGDDIYYVAANGERVKLSVEQNDTLRKTLSITVTRTTTTKGEKHEDGKTDAENVAKKKAIKDALTKAAAASGVDTESDNFKTAFEKAFNEQVTDGKTSGDFTVTVDGKTYTFTYDNVTAKVTESKDTTIEGKEDGKDITDAKDNTVTGSAYVTGGTVSWTDKDQSKSFTEITGNGGSELPTPDNVAGASNAHYDDNGKLLSFDVVTTTKDADGNDVTVTTTYTFTYKTLNDVDDVDALAWAKLSEKTGMSKEELIAAGYSNVRLEDYTSVTWNITTTTKTSGKNDVTETIKENRELTYEENGDFTFSEDKSTLTIGDKTYVKNAAGDYVYTETTKDGTVTVVTTETVSVAHPPVTDPDAVKNMLMSRFPDEIKSLDAITMVDLANKTATYTYTNADGKVVTVTVNFDGLTKTELTIKKSVDKALQTTISAENDADLDKQIEDFWNNKLKPELDRLLEENKDKDVEILLGDVLVKDTGESTKTDIIKYVKSAVSHKDMTPEQLLESLEAQEKLAKKSDYVANPGSKYQETLKNYYEGVNNGTNKYFYEKRDGTVIDVKRWDDFWFYYYDSNNNIQWVEWWNVTSKEDRNDIGHLDLASDTKLDLLPNEEGLDQDDCVLIRDNLKLEWNYEAADLLADQDTLSKDRQNHTVGLDDKISFDDEGGKGNGHYEYDRKQGANNNPTKSAFYKLTGTVVYNAVKDENGKVKLYTGWNAQEDAFNEYLTRSGNQAHYDSLTGKEKEDYKQQVLKTYIVEIGKTGTNNTKQTGYQVYLKSSEMTAYGYMTRDSNACINSTYKRQDGTWGYVGGYDLKISKLVQVSEGKIIGQTESKIKTIFAPISIRSSSSKSKSSMTVDTKKTSTPFENTSTKNEGSGTKQDGSYKYDLSHEENLEDVVKQTEGTGEDHYTSFVDLIKNFFTGTGTATEESGAFKYTYATEKDEDGNNAELEAVAKVTTVKKDASVSYDYKTVESKDTLIPGHVDIIVPPTTPDTPDDGDDDVVIPVTPVLPPVQDATPDEVVTPADPVLPPVQDATPDAVVTPENPVLPPVQDATVSALPQTGVNWAGAFGMALSGALMMVVGAFTSLKYKEKH